MNELTLEKIIRTQMRNKRTPGMAISVSQNNKMTYAKGFGARDLKQHQAMDADTLIGIGSVTKSFTAFAMMQLQEQGKLSLDDSASKYLPAEPFQSRPDITLKHMLSHTTGVPAMDASMLAFAYAFDDFSTLYPATNRDDFLAHMADAEEFIIFKPGEEFFYNNDMYTCLGFIIEALSGLSFEHFVQQHILDPLDMKRAVFTQQGLDNDPNSNAMTGYRFEAAAGASTGKTAAKASDVPIDGYLQAPGGLYASMNEMLHYAQCLLKGGEYQGVRLLSQASVDTLFAGIISTPYGESEDPQYALGWTIEQPSAQTPHRVIQHGGGMLTSSSFLLLVPELELAIMVAENANTGIPPLIARTALALVQEQIPEEVIEDLRISKLLKEVIGSYRSQYDMYDLTLSIKGGVLQADLLTDDGQFSFPLLLEDSEALEFKTYSLKATKRGMVKLYRNAETNKIEFCRYDRFLYKRV